MKISMIRFVFVLLVAQFFAANLQAESKAPKPKHSTSFSTSRDLAASESASNLTVHNTGSNFTLKNTGSNPAVVYGLYVRQFSYVAAGEPCTGATPIYSSSTNTSAGAMVMPVTIRANTEAAVGANYLYNMIYNASYYVRITSPSSPPGCALPGCTWGSDTTIYNWCVYIGAMAPVSATEGYTAKVVPSTEPVSSSGVYDYDLIGSYEYIGPISCNDQTLTCSLATPQTQSF